MPQRHPPVSSLRPVHLYTKGVKLTYNVTYIYGSIATKSPIKVYLNTRKTIKGSDMRGCLFRKIGACAKFGIAT